MSTPDLGRVVMVVPTYNERDNLAWIVGRLRAATPDVDVLVVDDGSPDGTGKLADELAAADPQVSVIHRAGKEGLGAAYLAGLLAASAMLILHAGNPAFEMRLTLYTCRHHQLREPTAEPPIIVGVTQRTVEAR